MSKLRPEYPIRVVQRARELREAGWSYDRITVLVERETGRRPNKSTVHRWCNQDAEQSRRASALRWHRRQRSADGATNGGRLGCPHHTPEYQEARARALLTVGGMLVTQVARAMAFDYPGQGWDYRRARRLAERIRTHGENGSVAA